MNEQLPQFSQINLVEVETNLTTILQNNLQKIDEILTKNSVFTWNNLFAPLEDLDDALNQFWSPVSHLHSVADSKELRSVYNACLPKLNDYAIAISHNQKLYQAVQSIADSEKFKELNPAQQKVITNQIRDFKLAGVALSKEEQKRFSELTNELSQLGTRFEENVLDATQAWDKPITNIAELSGIPETNLHAFEKAAQAKNLEGWLLNLEMPNYIAVITYADSRELRKEIHYAYVTRASELGPHAGQWDNTQVIHAILHKRLALAQLLDFKNFAEESLATKMAKSPQQVLDFLKNMLDVALPKAHQEFQQLKQFAKEHDGIEQLHAWDLAYYSEKLRQHQYAISEEELRPYFPEYKVIDGLFKIVQRLYHVTVEPVPNADTWHPDAHLFKVLDANKQIISYFYFDLYARANKRGGAWMDNCRNRRKLADGGIQLPIAFVTCNFNGPTKDKPALFTHDEVNTLFHEFGHALQLLLTKIDYVDVSGLNGIPWDAVEFPSQFFENWVWDREAIDLIAEHYATKEPLPNELHERMLRAKNFQAAMQTVRQVEFGIFDFRLHVEFDPTQENQAQRMLDEVRKETAYYPIPKFNRFQHGFSHIFAGGYAAGYYSYKWAEVMASDAFELFAEQGIFNSEISQKFKTTILEMGGAEDPMDLFVRFRGRPPEVKALLKQQGIID